MIDNPFSALRPDADNRRYVNSPGVGAGRRSLTPSPADAVDTATDDDGRMPRTWTHVGRCWTNGEPFLALDETLLPEWRGGGGGGDGGEVSRPDQRLPVRPRRGGIARGVWIRPAGGGGGWLEVVHAGERRGAVGEA